MQPHVVQAHLCFGGRPTHARGLEPSGDCNCAVGRAGAAQLLLQTNRSTTAAVLIDINTINANAINTITTTIWVSVLSSLTSPPPTPSTPTPHLTINTNTITTTVITSPSSRQDPAIQPARERDSTRSARGYPRSSLRALCVDMQPGACCLPKSAC